MKTGAASKQFPHDTSRVLATGPRRWRWWGGRSSAVSFHGNRDFFLLQSLYFQRQQSWIRLDSFANWGQLLRIGIYIEGEDLQDIICDAVASRKSTNWRGSLFKTFKSARNILSPIPDL